MDPTVEMEGSEEGNIQENEGNKPTSNFADPKQAADPVVYKLVRVDFDGRLVPATDNELMEVDDLFDYGNGEMFSVADVMQTAGFGFSEVQLPDKVLSGGDEASSQYENKGVEAQSNAIVECDDRMLQRAAEEERHESANVSVGKPDFDPHVMDIKGLTEIPAEVILSASDSTLQDTGNNQYVNSEDCSNMQDESIENETSASTASTTLKPDFSLLRGEINLDKLTMRELQETFRATFGRGTSVKDKQWLKRRISMGLVKSCDIPLTSFIIKDNMLVKKVEDANGERLENVLAGEIRHTSDTVKDMHVDYDNKPEDAKSTRLRNLLIEDASNDNRHIDQRAVKRVRKPTKRYIEEVSELENQETVGSLIPSVKQSGVKDLSKSADRPACDVKSSSIVMRHDCLGGSAFQVPRVSRIRRCRPRKGIITLTPTGLEADLARDAANFGSINLADIGVEKASEATSVPCRELPSDEEKSEKLCSEIVIAKLDEEQEPKSADSSGNNPNSSFTAKGGMRRKHHRAWSLSEVVKLVDGVSRYGAGRWSEIKRISFASYSYRTSVDLKDKWRNLLKASFAVMPSDKGMSQQQQQQQRKPTSMPIPTPILLKVRELAELNGQAPRNFKASSDNGGPNV